MRIGIDYTAAARQRAGIGRYARELVSAILAESAPHTYTLMAATAKLGPGWPREQARLHQATAAPDRLRFRALPLTDDWMARLWQRLRLPIPAEVITGPLDLFYAPDFVLPPLRPRTYALLTVHDLSFLRHPETFTEALRRYLIQAVPRSVTRADHIFADSEATRQDLITLLDVPAEKVTVLYSGVSTRFIISDKRNGEASEERTKLQEKYGIGARPYILSLGTVQPRKNYVRLMQACDPLTHDHSLDLVIVGHPAWKAEPILAAASERPYVHLLGFADDEDLPNLYRQAALFAFPSLYEGFGIPPLEAMACGTPVVASSASSVPEVVGEAGLLVDPLDVSAWTEALSQALTDEALRATLIRRGYARARTFTWANAAQNWLAAVEKLVEPLHPSPFVL